MRSSLLFFHICSGTIGVLSGFVAVFLRKGSRGHRILGNVFFVSMLGLGSSGAYLGSMKSEATNVLGGILTCYMVATAWMTARRRTGEPGTFDSVALLIALAVGFTEVTFGIQALKSPTGLKYGYPAVMYFVFGSIALLAATGDVRMLVRRGVSGTQRLVRHLWRMCFALFVASGSIFLARPHLFPSVLRRTYVITLLGWLPLILMIFWLIWVRFAKARKGIAAPDVGQVYSLRTQATKV